MSSGDFLRHTIINPQITTPTPAYIRSGLVNGRIILLDATNTKEPFNLSKLSDCFYLFLEPSGNLSVFDEQLNKTWSSETGNQGVDSLHLSYLGDGFLSLMKGGTQIKPIILGVDI